MSGRRTASREKSFYEKKWSFRCPGRNKTEILAPGNYEWPFDCILEGNMPESVEGLKDVWIIYRLKAEIGRKRAKDIIVRKPLRLIRTLDSSALELTHAMSVENIWPNKVEYSISIPSKAVIFGSFIQIDFKLIPLLKGLVIGNIGTQLREEQEFCVDPEWNATQLLNNGISKVDRLITYENYTINPAKDETIIDEQAEGFQFSQYIELPKSLNKCLQDCNTNGIKVRHKVKFNIQLHNPDGHVSELRANLPVSLYISPSLPIDDNNDLVDQTPQATRAAIAHEISSIAPPLYGEHQLDQLYSEVDPTGYRTPGWALSTEATPYSHSRNISDENLTHPDVMPGSVTPNGHHVNPTALQYRLQNLRVSRSPPRGHNGTLEAGDSSRRSSGQNEGTDYFAVSPPQVNGHLRISPHILNGGSPPGSTPQSRRSSEEDDVPSGLRTPFGRYHHMEDLAKVPSYSTAVKTPAPRRKPLELVDLPTYGAAVSRDPSPPAIAEPPTAHLRGPPRTGTISHPSPPEPSSSGLH